MIASFNKFTSCRRRRSDDLNTFFSRFLGLAADHLMHGGLSSSSQGGGVLAITLLNNTGLSEETFTNAKLQLISLAHTRENQRQAEAVHVPNSKLDELSKVTAQLGEMPDELHFRCFTDETLATTKAKIKKCLRAIPRSSARANRVVSSIDATLQESTADLGGRLLRPNARCRWNLDDAVVVLRNLSFSPSKEKQMYHRTDIENMVAQKVQTTLFALSEAPRKSPVFTRLGPARACFAEAPRPLNAVVRRKSGRSTHDFCYDCGSTSCIRGEDECHSPSFMSKKLKSQSLAQAGSPSRPGSLSGRREKGKPEASGCPYPFTKGSTALKRKYF